MRKIKVAYTVHADRVTVEKKTAVFEVSELSAQELAMVTTPVTRAALNGPTSCFNLKTALHWIARLYDCFFEADDEILSIKEVKK